MPRVRPLSVERPKGPLAEDAEGRVLIAEFEQFYLVTAYVPNSGKKIPNDPNSGLTRLEYRTNAQDGWDVKLATMLKVVQEGLACCLFLVL